MSKLVLTTLLGRLDKRLYFGPHSTLALKELPDPALPAPDWVTIRTRLCGICGSDYKQVFLNGSVDNPMTALISFPQVLGHEVVGTIERVGPAVRSRRLGERVVLNPWLSCAPRGIEPPCPACRNGQYSICRNFARGSLPPGIHTGNSSKATGGFAPRVPAHESMCIPVPDAVSDEQAVLADPFSVSLHGFLKRTPAPGTTALVYGCGTLGLMAIAILRALAPTVRVIAVARFPHQKALAERFGAALVLAHEPLVPLIEGIAAETGAELMRPWHGAPWLHGGGIGVVYDTVGSPETVEVALRVAAPRGAVVATELVRRLRAAGHEAYFAGGCVRDRLLGREPLDYDIATSAPPETVQALFPRTVPVGAQFGVVLVVADGMPVEVATFRSDAAYVDGRRPSAVHFGSAREDALRRDFTVNALFLDPLTGEVVDFVAGQTH